MCKVKWHGRGGPREDGNRPTHSTGLTIAWLAGLLIVAVGLAYSRTFHSPFVFDDLPRIVQDSRLRSAWPPWPVLDSSNRPFAHYTFALNYAVHGYDVVGYHVVNLLIHIAAALTLMGLVRRLWLACYPDQPRTALGLGWSIAILWAVHPLNTQSVTYIVQRLESLMGLCYLLTLYAFVRATQSSGSKWFWFALALVSCSFGMGCKEVMVTAPLVVLACDRMLLAHTWRELFEKRGRVHLLLASSWCVLAWSMWHYQVDYRGGGLLNVPGLTPWVYLLNQSAVILHYLRLAVWPTGQCIYYAWPVEHSWVALAPALTTMSLAVITTLILCYRKPSLGFVAICFLIILAPTSSVVPIVDLAFEHRMYLPLISIISLICLGLLVLVRRITAMTAVHSDSPLVSPPGDRLPATYSVIIVVIAVALAATTYSRNTVYASEETLWRDTLAKAPHNVDVWLGLGARYAKSERFAEAEECFLNAITYGPDKAEPKAVYAGLLISRADYTRAAELLNEAAKLEPDHRDVIINMGHLLSLTGQYEEAQAYLEAGVKAVPDDEELQTNLIVNLCYLGRLEDALERAQANLEQRPQSARATNDVAACWLAKGEPAMAEIFSLKAIELDPRFARAHGTLGIALADRDPQRAIEHLQQASQLDAFTPEYPMALGNLLMPSDPEAAAVRYQHVLKLRPEDVEAMLRQAMAWDSAGQPQRSIPLLEQALNVSPDLEPVKMYLQYIRAKLP